MKNTLVGLANAMRLKCSHLGLLFHKWQQNQHAIVYAYKVMVFND